MPKVSIGESGRANGSELSLRLVPRELTDVQPSRRVHVSALRDLVEQCVSNRTGMGTLR